MSQDGHQGIIGLGIALLSLFIGIPESRAIETTTTTVTTSQNPSTYGQSVTLTATVTAASGTPGGNVSFLSGTKHVGIAALSGGVASLSTTALSAGSLSITAVYGGNARFSGSTSSVLNQVVNQVSSTVALASSLNPSTAGQPVTLTATVSAAAGTPTGNVAFLSGTKHVGIAALSGGIASLSTTTLSAGSLSITAVYGGNANISGSTSPALTQVVDKIATSVALTSSLNPSTFGQSVTFTATVSATSGTPTGNVFFRNGSATLGSIALAGGAASLSTTSLTPGSRKIVALYGGSADFGAASATLTQTVHKAVQPSYALAVTSLSPSSIAGGSTSTSPISLTTAYGYSGNVNLSCSVAGGSPAPSCSFNPSTVAVRGDAPNKATLTVSTSSSTPAGTYSITVNASDANGLTPTNGPQTLTLTILPSMGYALSVTALSPNVVTAGNTSVSTITVTPISGYAGSVTLSCSMITGGMPAPSCAFNPSSVTVGGSSPGTATLTVSTSSSTPAGPYGIVVTGSDANQLAPSDGPQDLTLTIAPAGAPGYELTAAALNPSSVPAGTNSTSTITVTSTNGYTGSVNLSCSITGGGTPPPTCTFNPASVILGSNGSGSSTLTVSPATSTPAGAYTISATGSDGNQLAPSNGPSTLSLTVGAVFQHVVIIFQENRSTDNLFQDPVLIAEGADIASSGINSLGEIIPLSPIGLGTSSDNPDNYDLAHSHTAFVSMYDGGNMDGADRVKCTPNPGATCPVNPQFMYVNPADVQPYFALAEQYTFGDRMFQTNESSSFAAHQFILSGTSAPTATSPLFAAEIPYPPGVVGCIAAQGTLVAMIDATGSETNPAPEYPCFEHPTLTDLLDSTGVTWRYYTPATGTIWTAPNAIEHICQPQTIGDSLYCTGAGYTNNVIIPQSQVLTDIANGQLPQVTWVIPNGVSSDHPGGSEGSGPSWVAAVVNAIGNSPYWANTAIFITWDDWGGWYDHVTPPVIDDGVSWGSGFVYGFRVPLIVVSPYAKAGYISHATHDFGSILKFIETNFNLPSLGYADQQADDLSDCFDLTQTPITFSVIPAPLDAAHFINDKRPPTDPDDD